MASARRAWLAGWLAHEWLPGGLMAGWLLLLLLRGQGVRSWLGQGVRPAEDGGGGGAADAGAQALMALWGQAVGAGRHLSVLLLLRSLCALVGPG